MMRNIKQIEEFADHLGGNIVRRKLTHIESCRWNDRRCVNLSKKVGNIFSMQTLTSCIAKALPSDTLVVHEKGGWRVRFFIHYVCKQRCHSVGCHCPNRCNYPIVFVANAKVGLEP